MQRRNYKTSDLMPLSIRDVYISLSLSENEADYDTSLPMIQAIFTAVVGGLSILCILLIFSNEISRFRQIALAVFGFISGLCLLGFKNGMRAVYHRAKFKKGFHELTNFYHRAPKNLTEHEAKNALKVLSCLSHQQILSYVADFPAETMSFLAKSEYERLRATAAAHPNTAKLDLIQLASERGEEIRNAAVSQLLKDADSQALVELAKSRYEDVRQKIAQDQRTPRQVLLKLALDASKNIRDIALPQILQNATPNEIEALLAGCYDERTAVPKPNYADVRLELAKNVQTSRSALLKFAQDTAQNIRELVLPRILQDVTLLELQQLSESPFEDVKRMTIKKLGEKQDERGAAMIWAHLKEPFFQQDVVEAFLNIEGNFALPKIIENLGLNQTFRITAEERLVEYFKAKEPQELAETLSLLEKESKRINVGTVSVEREDTSYDPYGGSSTYTYTATEDEFLPVSYFSPQIVSKVLQILKALDAGERQSVLLLLSKKKAEFVSLLQFGLENQEWKNSIFEPILKSVREIQISNFSASSDESIIRQLV